MSITNDIFETAYFGEKNKPELLNSDSFFAGTIQEKARTNEFIVASML